MERRYDVLIVGSGHGGVQAAIQLRQHGFVGSIGMATADPAPPYDRPPLSKEYLAGTKDFPAILSRPVDFWRERDIGVLPGRELIDLDPLGREVRCASGEVIGYGHLIWAAGGRPRGLRCEGDDLAGVHVIRSITDVDRLRAELPAANRVVVIGGGYIGLEAAAVLRQLGKEVALVEGAEHLLSRVAAAPLSDFLLAEHRGHGVNVRLGAVVHSLVGKGGRVSHVELADGERLGADMVIVGIGIEPVVEPLTSAGAEGSDGVAVDQSCRTSLLSVWAIGDCALHHNRYGPSEAVRIESVQNAADMATVAVRDIMGQPAAYDVVPWFWSNQYDFRLQTVGLSAGYDEVLLRGKLSSRRFAVIYRRAGEVIALDCVNNVRDYAAGRLMVERRAKVDARRLCDPEVPLKSLV